MSQYGNYKCKEFEDYCQREARKRKAAKWVGGGIIAILIGLMLLFVGCRTHQPTVIEKEKIVYVTKDSIVHRDSLVYVPVESQKDFTGLLDTLFLSTSLAKSWSAVDTSKMLLVGEIKNIKALEVKYVEIEKWRTRDSIVQVEKPLPYPVVEEKRYIPTFAWICIVWAVISIVLLGIWLYMKFWH